MFVSVNSNPFTNGGSYIYQYDSNGNYTFFLSNLDHPRGLAFDSHGNLYVATFTWALDSNNNILGFDQATVLKVSGGVASTFATFSGSVTAVATDSADNVFVSSQTFDGTNSTIYNVTSGTVSTFGSVPGQCFGLAFDSAGNLFAAGADSTLTSGTIYKFPSTGGMLSNAPSVFVGSAAFSSGPGPVGLAFDAAGNLFVSTSNGNGEIRRFASDGTEITPQFATGLTNNPRGLAFDNVGNLFLAEPGLGAVVGDILKFTPPNGTPTVFASQGFGTRGNRGPEFLAFAPGSNASTSTGSNVTTNAGTVGFATIGLTFPQVTSAGTTTVLPVNPSSAGYTLGGSSLGFDITTTATYTTPIIIGFQVARPLDVTQLTVFHNEGGTLVNVTCPSPNPGPTPDTTTNTIYASVTSLSPFVVAQLPFTAQVQQPINADGTSVFTSKRGVVPVKFTLIQNGATTCTLPPATIAVTRTAGGTTGAVDESVYSGSADTGSNFRIDSCQYVYNLSSTALGPGTYRVDIKINDVPVGSATFQLK
jgi:sugar lactone lactonase YvrE